MRRYAIAAGHEATAAACEDILRAGGTAVDAAIAGAVTAFTAEPVLAGLLGGGFLMVRKPEGRVELIDGFVQAPRRKRPEDDLDFRAIHADFGETTQEFHIGAGAIATPGLAPALAEAHLQFGRMPLRDLVAPGARAARDGVAITDFQARLNGIVAPILKATPAARARFCDAEGELLRPGSRYTNPELADVLEVFGHEGPRFVTEGEVALGLLALAREGGHLTADDLRHYRPKWRRPLEVTRGARVRIAANPPPALGGALVAFALELIGRSADPAEIARAFEATTRARIEAGLREDPEGGTLRLLSPELVARYRAELQGRRAAVRGTTHISVIDGDGMGVALTLSNGEGNGDIIPGTGIMPNNMLGEEDLVPGGWHSWHPDRRLSSMMTPMAVSRADGGAAMLGSGGSNRIRTALAQVLVNLIDREMPLTEAIEAPRLHVEACPPAVDFELTDLAEEDRAAILAAYPEARGWAEHSMFFGGVHAAARDGRGNVAAVGDLRRGGVGLTG